MKLKSLRINNFRCFQDETIFFDDYSCLVGPNGAGKSTVLMALNVFFRNTEAPTNIITLIDEDFHNRNTSVPIIITATFCELSADAKLDLKAYVRQDELIVSAKAIWDEDSQTAEVKQYGSRQVILDFAPYFAAYDAGGKAPELKSIFQSIRSKYTDVAQATAKDAMRDALRDYEEAHQELCKELESQNQFYGWTKGSGLLSRYCQWVYLPAVKDPSDEQDEQKNSSLGKLLSRTIRSEIDFSESVNELHREASTKYEALLIEQNSVLGALQNKIQDSLREWSHPGANVNLEWFFDDKKSVTITDPFARATVGEGNFIGELVRAGHGMQRSFLIALLQVLADIEGESSPSLILGFEEPELYQHPPQAKHLSWLLEELSKNDNQIIITTHSPYFVSSKGYENIRLIRWFSDSSTSKISQVGYEQLCSSIASALKCNPQAPTELMASVEQIMQPSQCELFFCKVPILVEGPEDVAFISAYISFTNKWADFRRFGCHFVVSGGKTSMSRPLVIAQHLGLPVFIIFDGDCDKAVGTNEAEHRRDNGCLLNLMGNSSDQIITEPLITESLVMWHTRILDVMREDVGSDTWDTVEQEVRNVYKLQSGVKRKNPLLIAAVVERLLESGNELKFLEKLTTSLFLFAEMSTKSYHIID